MMLNCRTRLSYHGHATAWSGCGYKICNASPVMVSRLVEAAAVDGLITRLEAICPVAVRFPVHLQLLFSAVAVLCCAQPFLCSPPVNLAWFWFVFQSHPWAAVYRVRIAGNSECQKSYRFTRSSETSAGVWLLWGAAVLCLGTCSLSVCIFPACSGMLQTGDRAVSLLWELLN